MLSKQPPQPVESVVLESNAGIRVTLLNLGATIQSIQVPTADGVVEAVLGFENPDDYWADAAFIGTTVGRFANRIRDARFVLDGKVFNLDANEVSTGHCLHGGSAGFQKRFWALRAARDGRAAEYRYRSADRECGFPGNLDVSINYQIVNDYSLVMDYRASSDCETIVSLANHAYFNLDRRKSTIDTHRVSIDAVSYTPKDAAQIPTGEVREVRSSKFDLRRPTMLRQGSRRLRFDDNFVLCGEAGRLRRAAEFYSPDSGVGVRLHTTQAGLQLYTGDHLTSPFRPRQGLCLEAQAFPNAPNEAGFPSARLAAGDVYRQRTIYEFRSANPYL